MSVQLMSKVFEATIPPITVKRKVAGVEQPRKVQTPVLKLVLLALADHANDEGEGAYPSMTRLERKTGLARSSVNFTLRALRQEGYILNVGISKRGTTNYTLQAEKLLVAPDYQMRKPVVPDYQGQERGTTGASSLGLPESPYNHPQPSVKGAITPAPAAPQYLGGVPILPRKEKESETAFAKRAQAAAALQRSMAAQEGQVDLSWLFPPLQTLAREFCAVSGCRPIKRDQNLWKKELGTWAELGFTPEIVREAYAQMQADRLTCSGPESLTKIARSLVNSTRAGETGYSSVVTTKIRAPQPVAA